MGKKLVLLWIFVCLPAYLRADFSYDQTTRMSGGSMMAMMKIAGAFSKQVREPVQTTVSVKGNRMVHWSKDHAQIIDLDSETITEVNFNKKQYSVMTFAEMTQAMQQAMQRAQDRKADSKPAVNKPGDTTTEFKVDIKETGQRKQIAGFDAKEMIMSMQMDSTDQKTGNKGGMLVTNDMWIAQKSAGYDEIREFHRKMAQKMTWTPGSSPMMPGGADMIRGMAGISKEMAKMDGMTVLMVMKMVPTADGQPISSTSGSEGQQTAPQQSRPKPEAPSIGGVLGGKLGGFGGFGRKKKPEAPKEEKPETASASAPSGSSDATLMEMTTEMSGFSSAPADPSKFAVPAGFKKVESEMQKRQR